VTWGKGGPHSGYRHLSRGQSNGVMPILRSRSSDA
jgi:hypothetical protein